MEFFIEQIRLILPVLGFDFLRAKPTLPRSDSPSAKPVSTTTVENPVFEIVNGLPIAVLELKNPSDENATLDGAFDQLQTYKAQIPSLFRGNAALVVTDGLQARIVCDLRFEVSVEGFVTAGKAQAVLLS
ncbi:MAG: hypothetical protein H6970_09870 [Gammaproteobacteria bacterium]|nr:hypothetical protein [Gammaproteobacteria bacterium]